MYANRRRVGPPKSTPANVQCQKCLKRGHYSYECKAAPQERPYVPRPSRTQQLRNPKLRPQLTNDTPDALPKKSGVADAELAKKAAQRAQELKALGEEDNDDAEASRPGHRGTRQRRSRPRSRSRSRSYDSASYDSRRSASPPSRGASISPRRGRSPSPRRRSPTQRSRRSYASADMSRSPSPRPDLDDRRRESRSASRGSYRRSSPPPRGSSRGSRDEEYYSEDERQAYRSRGSHPDAYNDDHAARRREARRHDSRSPERAPPPDRHERERNDARQYRDRRDPYNYRDDRDNRRGRSSQRADAPQAEPPRERSLSPFSKRLALTQAMKGRG